VGEARLAGSGLARQRGHQKITWAVQAARRSSQLPAPASALISLESPAALIIAAIALK
jgi:hypothetical protein